MKRYHFTQVNTFEISIIVLFKVRYCRRQIRILLTFVWLRASNRSLDDGIFTQKLPVANDRTAKSLIINSGSLEQILHRCNLRSQSQNAISLRNQNPLYCLPKRKILVDLEHKRTIGDRVLLGNVVRLNYLVQKS